MVSILDIVALLLTLSAGFAWLNARFVRLPRAIGLLVMGLAASLLLVLADVVAPGGHLYEDLTSTLQQIDFSAVVMNFMLGFLLFAGAMNVDFPRLRQRAWPVAALALAGTVISTLVVGLLFWLAGQAVGVNVSLGWALAFGALISPTDPVAVLTTLKNVRVPATLEVEMQGEALFNDGIGIVLFTFLVGLAAGGSDDVGVGQVLLDLLREAGGGLLLGCVTGYVAYRAMRAIDDFPVEVLVTLALVSGTYALAQRLAVSGPLAMVATGLLIGTKGTREAMSDRTQNYVTALWTMIDEVLNAVLFLLIGLEVLVLRFQPISLVMAGLALPIVLMARASAVAAPLLLFPRGSLSPRRIPFLTWAGVRGGISVALALALPGGPAKPTILAATYAVVLFTVIVQGSTLGMVARRTLEAEGPDGG